MTICITILTHPSGFNVVVRAHSRKLQCSVCSDNGELSKHKPGDVIVVYYLCTVPQTTFFRNLLLGMFCYYLFIFILSVS